MDVLPHLTLLNFSSQAWTLDTVNSVYHNIRGTAKLFFIYTATKKAMEFYFL